MDRRIKNGGFLQSARWCRRVGLVALIAVVATVIQGVGIAGPADAAAPPVDFALPAGGTGFDQGSAVAVDGSGNTYVTGSFNGFADFGPTRFLLSAGKFDVFVAKLDSTGKVLWAKSMGGTEDDQGFGIAVDGSGNSYITGEFRGTATFGATTLVSAGAGDFFDTDVFVAKLDSAGAVSWATSMGGTSGEGGRGVALDGSGNTYITGSFRGSATFGSTTLSATSEPEVFVAKLDSGGAVVWATSAGGAGPDRGVGVAVDDSGNISIVGLLSGSSTFGSTTLVSAGNNDAFVAKLDSTGAVLWARQMGGISYDQSWEVAVDGSGNSYITGVFWESATFGAITLTAAGQFDVFVAKFDSAGTLSWATSLGGTGNDEGLGIAVDGSGNPYITGSFRETATFGATVLTAAGAVFEDDVFVAKLDGTGAVVWATAMGGTGNDEGLGVAVDGLGNPYITGVFQGSANFGAATLVSAGGNDVFVAKLDVAAFCDGKLVTIDMNFNGGIGIGTGGPDVILGTPAADVIRGFGGDDTICAGGRADRIRAGGGSDTIFGEGGADNILGGGGADVIDGGPGADDLSGQGGTDTLYGRDGPDTLNGQGAADMIFGGDQNDTVNGQNGADIIRGGDGADTIKGQTGPDTLLGQSGDDDLFGGNGNDTLFGGAGFDKCSGNLGRNDIAEAATCEQTPGVETLF